ncbi:hypothetical protein Salat_1126700 [Sesamum alatum]|uniref:Uncharacterized protein n=1 Tax=Sesamum alatum TaxID=300844 RepID=A0AAE2CN40_9LAMI|nr:hypothetical protein Salat_1126700 [Sesamum alatum]
MNARVAEIARNLQRQNSPAAAPPPPTAEVAAISAADQPGGSSELQASVPVEVEPRDVHIPPGDTHTSGPVAIVSPGARAAIEIASSGSKGASGEVKAARVLGESSKGKMQA